MSDCLVPLNLFYTNEKHSWEVLSWPSFSVSMASFLSWDHAFKQHAWMVSDLQPFNFKMVKKQFAFSRNCTSNLNFDLSLSICIMMLFLNIFIFIYLFIFLLFERQVDIGRKRQRDRAIEAEREKDRGRIFKLLAHLPNFHTTAGLGPGKSQEPITSPRSPT